jgi:hypothetical protein
MSIDPIVGSLSTSWYDVDELIATLQAWGVSYLVGLEPTVPSTPSATDQQSVVAFLQRLAQCDEYPRVRDAIISLLLLHPELAGAVHSAPLREAISLHLTNSPVHSVENSPDRTDGLI